MRAVLSLVLLASCAGQRYYNVLGGPVVGYRIAAPPGDRLVYGLEGGGGWSLERFNVGVEHRAGTNLYYLELDPWYLLGLSLGFAVDGVGEAHPILGAWEGIGVLTPTNPPDCFDVPDDRNFYTTVTFSIGYRYTGEHEVYFAPKIGGAQKPYFCE